MKHIGIDAGGTLTKMVYYEKERVHYKIFPSSQINEALNWIQVVAPHGEFFVTGGKSEKWKSSLSQVHIIPEFKAVCEGSIKLLKEEQYNIERFILINIGTGTSYFKVERNEYTRILGSGMGGGTFMGLGSLLTGVDNYHQLVNLNINGDRQQVDLLVNDVYEGGESPLPENLTAANFARIGSVSSTHADRLRALTNMIAETTILLASQIAQIHKIEHLVFVGSTLASHPALREDLSQFKDMLSYSPIFLKDSSYAGALGAYQLGMKLN